MAKKMSGRDALESFFRLECGSSNRPRKVVIFCREVGIYVNIAIAKFRVSGISNKKDIEFSLKKKSIL